MAYCGRCGKHGYPRLRSAIRAILRRSQQAGMPLRYYLCPVGNGWHLTKRTKNGGTHHGSQ